MRYVAALLLCLMVPVLMQAPARAQDVQKPVMQNVFFNVVWGSAFGATVGVAVSVLSSSDKSAPSDVRQGAFSGATAGGLIGLGLALYLVYQGITFDPATSTFTGVSGDPPTLPPVAQLDTPPFMLITSPTNPHKITGFSARVIDLKF
ncbi:MAG TPA: hypothetical protein VKB51_01270 [bacterium]|nr:hypothetical protein [bacterium]